MERIDIVHVHPQSAGADSGYLLKISDALDTHYSQAIVTNFYNTISKPYCYKLFFQNTEVYSGKFKKRSGFKFLICLAIELWKGYFRLLRIIRQTKPRIINFSLTSSRWVDLLIMLIHLFHKKTKVVVTCHDVTPPLLDRVHSLFAIKYKRIYKRADALLVHSPHDVDIITEKYQVPREKIFYHPFPLKGLRLSPRKLKPYIHFSLVGVLSPYKGVDILSRAWCEYLSKRVDIHLTIAGMPAGIDDSIFDDLLKCPNVTVTKRFLTTSEYCSLVSATDYILLPYRTCGNSGVLADFVSSNCVPVVSNLTAFVNSPYILPDCVVSKSDSDGFGEMIVKLADGGNEMLEMLQSKLAERIESAEKNFDIMVKKTYQSILSFLKC